MPTGARAKMLYIAGYSRCGSTILTMVLNHHREIASTGELTYLVQDAADPTQRCTCGAPYRTCSLYGDWLAGRPEGEAELVRSIESRSNLDTLLARRVSQADRVAYADYACSLIEHLQQRTSASIIVDSSKSARDAAGRPLAMLQLGGIDVRVLHLSRDPRSTMRSYLDKGSNWVLEGRRQPRLLDSLRPIIGWTLANRTAYRLREELGPDRYLHMRFEDFRADPRAALMRIGALIDADLESLGEKICMGEKVVADHSVGGNRIRQGPQQFRLQAESDMRLPLHYSLCLQLVGGRVARRLGYRRSPV